MSERKYTHTTYGMSVSIPDDVIPLRYHKKAWVPLWLWNLVAYPDLLDMLRLKCQSTTHTTR